MTLLQQGPCTKAYQVLRRLDENMQPLDSTQTLYTLTF